MHRNRVVDAAAHAIAEPRAEPGSDAASLALPDAKLSLG